jgi:hypothetical protein
MAYNLSRAVAAARSQLISAFAGALRALRALWRPRHRVFAALLRSDIGLRLDRVAFT